MTSPLTEFTLFPRLLPEIRTMIWELVPHPQRIVGVMPDHCPHDDWDFRLIVQPRNQAIFPPLQACGESRAVWLQKLSPLPRRIHLPGGKCVLNDVPYISYETDVFTKFSIWGDVNLWNYPYLEGVDLFPGIDKGRIQHMAIAAHNLHSFAVPGTYIRDSGLHSLQRVTLLNVGPTPQAIRLDKPRHLETEELELTQIDCELRDVPLSIIKRQRFFDHSGGLFRTNEESIVEKCLMMIRASLWHATRSTALELHPSGHWDYEVFHTDEFVNYLKGTGDEQCPVDFAVCQHGHTREEMLQGPDGIRVGLLVMCEQDWMKKLAATGLFDADSPDDDNTILERVRAVAASWAHFPVDGHPI